MVFTLIAVFPWGVQFFCYYFEAFSSFTEWTVFHVTGSENLIHYLNDFLLMGPASSNDFLYMFMVFRMVCTKFSVLLADDKSVWLTTSLEFLGITIDTGCMEFCLPSDKVSCLHFFCIFCY